MTTRTRSTGRVRAVSVGRRAPKVVAMAGAETLGVIATRWILAAPTMYALVSFNEVRRPWVSRFLKSDVI